MAEEAKGAVTAEEMGAGKVVERVAAVKVVAVKVVVAAAVKVATATA